MIRLTVLYNLPPDADEEEFLAWRLGEHQENNMAMPGVIATAFHRIERTAAGEEPPYRFMTTVDWPDRESFERGFYNEKVQAKLQEDVKRIRDTVFLISEELTSGRVSDGGE